VIRQLDRAATLDEALDIATLNLAQEYLQVDHPIAKTARAMANSLREWAEEAGILHLKRRQVGDPSLTEAALVEMMGDVWRRSLKESGANVAPPNSATKKAFGRLLAMLDAQMPKREDEAVQAIPIVVGAMEELMEIQKVVGDSSGEVMSRLLKLSKRLGRHVIDEAAEIKERRR